MHTAAVFEPSNRHSFEGPFAETPWRYVDVYFQREKIKGKGEFLTYLALSFIYKSILKVGRFDFHLK